MQPTKSQEILLKEAGFKENLDSDVSLSLWRNPITHRIDRVSREIDFTSLDFLFRYILPPIREKYLVISVDFGYEGKDGIECFIRHRREEYYGWLVAKANGATEAEALCNALIKLVEGK